MRPKFNIGDKVKENGCMMNGHTIAKRVSVNNGTERFYAYSFVEAQEDYFSEDVLTKVKPPMHKYEIVHVVEAESKDAALKAWMNNSLIGDKAIIREIS